MYRPTDIRVTINGGAPMPALHRAAECQDIVVLRKLLAAGADPNERHEIHSTPLERACVAAVSTGAAITSKRPGPRRRSWTATLVSAHFWMRVLIRTNQTTSRCGKPSGIHEW